MADTSAIRQVAEFLYRAHREREVFARLPAHISPATIEEAYEMQDAFNSLVAPERGPLAGYKIALTTPVMQRMVGFDAPCAGAVFRQGVHHSPATVNGDDYVRLGAECEVAVRLSHDLPASGAPYDRTKASHAVGALMAAFELVDDRSADYSNLYFLDVVADNTWNAGVVLGPEITDWTALELGDAQGDMTINGATAGTGHGRDVLGHPMDALAWLANTLSSRGKELSAGMIVMTGSIVSTKFLNPGDQAVFNFEGLGKVSLTVS